MVQPAPDRPVAHTVDIRNFIFVRELAEVYLLLDHISGRWDKHIDNDSESLLAAVCAIGWPPDGNEPRMAAQAAILLKVKDRLNAAARPASGVSIAFTLLFVGEEDPRRSRPGWLQRWRSPWPSFESERRQADSTALAEIVARLTGMATAPPSELIIPGLGFTRPPSRMSLARTAFPGLVTPAARFRRLSKFIQMGLICGLLVTCLLSWYIAAGNVVLAHVDRLHNQQAALARRISAAETRLDAQLLMRQDRPAQERDLPAPVRFCDPARRPLAEPYRTLEEYHVCGEKDALEKEQSITRHNLNAWLAPWKAVYRLFITALPDGQLTLREARQQRIPWFYGGDEEAARILAQVVGGTVLPVCYAFLGACVALVRSLWAKLRENTLMHRDMSLAVGELALGATIGACIGLFVNPSGGHGMVTGWTLGSSALSFIAGFGVEGVFLAMEAFVRRVFGVRDPARHPS